MPLPRLAVLLAPVAIAMPLAGVAACTLLTPVDGLSGGATSRDGGGGAADASPPPDGASTEAGPAGEGGGDAGLTDADTPSLRYANAVLADKPLGYWRVEESATGVAKDETGTYPGAFDGIVSFGEPGVAGGRAIKLPVSKHGRVSLASSTAFRFPGTAPYSVELWVKPGVLQDYGALASAEAPQTSPTRNGWTILTDSAGIIHYEVWVTDQTGPHQARGFYENTTPLTAGAFRHVVVVYDGAQVLGYLDGVNESTASTGGIAPDVGELSWGCRSDESMCLDDWTIDELAIYDHALPPARVKAHYDLGK